MKGAGVLLAILLAVVLAAGQFGSGSAGEKDDDHSSSSSSDDHKDDSDHDDSDHDDADKGDSDKDDSAKDDSDTKPDKDASYAEAMKQHLEDQGLQVRQMSTSSDDDCAAHSYGQMPRYFAGHPCRGMDRAWYEVADDQDDTAIVSVAWVEMPDATEAADLKRLVDRPGTGNLTELSKEDGPYQGVSYSGWYYRSDVDGDTVHTVQAEPLADNDGSRALAKQASGATATD